MNNAIDFDQDFCITPNKTINEKLLNLLKSNDKYVNNNGQILRLNVIDDANNEEEELLDLLLSNDKIKETFFKKVSDIYIFRKKDFIDTINSYNFMPNSYTKFCERIGLVDRTGAFLADSNDVVLQFPHKDCYLEGGQTKEDQKYTEIFYNEVLARDEVDRLLAPKVFSNVTKYSKEGLGDLFPLKEEQPTTFDIEHDNLLIKGNNLVALSSLLERYEGQIKCIYIDPPYNTHNDSFGYNDNFNHGSWLVFMKNRLEMAKKLLSKNGVIYVSINHIELGYILVLMDMIFGKENKLPLVTLKTGTTASYRSINECPVNVTEYVLGYKMPDFIPNTLYRQSDYSTDYSHFIVNEKDIPEKWVLKSIADEIHERDNCSSWREYKKKHGENWQQDRFNEMRLFAMKNKERVVSLNTLQKPSKKVQEIIDKSKQFKDKIFVCERENGSPIYCRNGRTLAFFSAKYRNLDGENVPTEVLTNLWTDISFLGIGPEGGVTLENGKKPEYLIKTILDLSTKENDIVLDYHLGSGTTAAVAHKMNRRYIGVEQLDYNENDSLNRLINVLNGDTSGISQYPNVTGQGNGSFIYCKLAEDKNAQYLKKIDSASEETINDIRDEIIENAIIRYEADKNTEALKAKDWSFTYNEGKTKKEYKLETLEDKKNALKQLIDKNYMYINYSEMDDSKYSYLSETDKAFTKSFYEGV
jgi:adenine-specific DNA-methyltransferase